MSDCLSRTTQWNISKWNHGQAPRVHSDRRDRDNSLWFTSDGRETRGAGAGSVLGDWGRLVKRTTFSYVYMTVAIIKEN